MLRVRAAAIVFVCSSVLAGGTRLLADASVTAATGGGAISADTVGGFYTTLTGPRLVETDKAGINVGRLS